MLLGQGLKLYTCPIKPKCTSSETPGEGQLCFIFCFRFFFFSFFHEEEGREENRTRQWIKVVLKTLPSSLCSSSSAEGQRSRLAFLSPSPVLTAGEGEQRRGRGPLDFRNDPPQKETGGSLSTEMILYCPHICQI